MARSRKTFLLLPTTVGLLLMTPTANAQERPLTKITIAYGAINANVAPLWVARDHGLFAKHGLDSQATFIIAGRAAQAMLAGEVQLGLMGPTHMVRLKLNPKAAEVTADDVVTLDPLRRLEPFMESLLR